MKTENLGYIEGLGEIHRIYAPFTEQLEVFRKMGIKAPVSIRDASLIRIRGKSIEGTRTCHAPIYLKDSPTIIARISPLVKNLEMAKKAVDAHRNNNYPVFDTSIYAQWEKIAKQDKGKKPEKRRAIVLPERNNFRIHRDSEEAEFFWQDKRNEYFKRFVPSDKVKVYQIDLKDVDSSNGTIINYVWFDFPEVGSALVLGDWILDYGNGAFGVLEKTSSAGAQKILGNLVRPYTQREAKKYIDILQKVMSGKAGTSKLEKVLKHFEK